MMPKTKKKVASETECLFTVIKFIEYASVLFDAIPDVWFTDEYKESCFWPPSKGKNVALRAMKREQPDASWKTYKCEVVKGGFVTYSCAKTLVREKCSQKYNTSSAEEHIQAAKFRRQHPALSSINSESFEDVFVAEKSVESLENNETEEYTLTAHKSLNDGDSMHSTHRRPISTFADIHVPQNTDTGNVLSASEVSSKTIRKTTSPNRSRRSSRSSSRRSTRHSESGASSIRSSMRRQSYNESRAGSIRSSRCRSNHSRRSSRSSSKRSTRHSESRASSIRSSTRRQSHNETRASISRSSVGRQSRNEGRSSSRSNSSISRSRYSRNQSVSNAPSSFSIRLQKEKYIPKSDRNAGNISLPVNASVSCQSATTHGTGRNGSRSGSRSYRSPSRSYRSRTRSSYSRCHSASSRSSPNQLQNRNYKRNSIQTTETIPSPGIRQNIATESRVSSVPCSPYCQSRIIFQNVIKELRDLTKTTVKYQHQNDRRLCRMEVSINKTLVRLGDITRSNAPRLNDESEYAPQRKNAQRFSGEGSRHEATRAYSGNDSRREDMRDYSGNGSRCGDIQLYSGSRHQREVMLDDNHSTQRSMLRDQRCPDFPIKFLNELLDMNQRLSSNEFFTFLVNREIEYCMPGKETSNTVVMTTYLKRFVSLRVRSLLTLKESKGSRGITMMADFYNTYTFLITVMRQAYKACKKTITEKEAHEALRIVWGRSKQLLNDEARKHT